MGTDIAGVDLMRYIGPPLRDTFAEYYPDEARIEQATELYRRQLRGQGLPHLPALSRRGRYAAPPQSRGADHLHRHLQAY